MSHVGQPMPQLDGLRHVTGAARYVDDVTLPGMLHAVCVTSPVHKGRIRGIDARAALAAKGVVAVLTAADIPGENAYGLIPDQPVFAANAVRYRGERIAAVVAETLPEAEAAARLVALEIDEEAPVFDPFLAMAPDAPLVRPEGNIWHFNSGPTRVLRLGNTDDGFAEADVIFEGVYAQDMNEHAPIETHVSVAFIDEGGRLAIHTVSQAPHFHRSMLARIFNLPEDKVRYLSSRVGGAFGGKNDIHCDHVAGLAALKTGRPVKYRTTRIEDTLYSTKRGAWHFVIRDGVKRDGRITARQIRAVHDCGAYSGMGTYIPEKIQIFCAGPYRIPNIAYDAQAVFTNKPIASSMRGFGAINILTAIETQMNRLAEAIDMDPWTIRFINAWREGDIGPTRYPVPAPGLVEAMKAAARLVDVDLPQHLADSTSACAPAPLSDVSDHLKIHWPAAVTSESSDRDRHIVRGRGMAAGLCSVGVGGGGDSSTIELELEESGSIILRGGFVELGQGSRTVLRQIAADALELPIDRIAVAGFDSAVSPPTTGTFASRITFMDGNAAILAARELVHSLRAQTARHYGIEVDSVQYRAGRLRVAGEHTPSVDLLPGEVVALANHGSNVRARATYTAAGGTGFDAATGEMRDLSSMSYGACVAEVAVDLSTGQTRVVRVAQALEVGKVINGLSARGQANGGMALGIGFALFESSLPYYPDIDHAAIDLHDYLVCRAGDMPRTSSLAFVEVPQVDGPFGAKGFGDGLSPSIVAPAIIAAVHDATGVWMCHLPATPERALRALTLRAGPH